MFLIIHVCPAFDVLSSSSSSSYSRRRCLWPRRKQLSSSAPPGCHIYYYWMYFLDSIVLPRITQFCGLCCLEVTGKTSLPWHFPLRRRGSDCAVLTRNRTKEGVSKKTLTADKSYTKLLLGPQTELVVMSYPIGGLEWVKQRLKQTDKAPLPLTC